MTNDDKKKEVFDGERLLRKMQVKERDEGRKRNNHEKWKKGDERHLCHMRHKHVPHLGEIKK